MAIQVYVLKPVLAVVSSTFLVLVVYVLGTLWEAIFPHCSEKQGMNHLSLVVNFVNPGRFSLGEVGASR